MQGAGHRVEAFQREGVSVQSYRYVLYCHTGRKALEGLLCPAQRTQQRSPSRFASDTCTFCYTQIASENLRAMSEVLLLPTTC